MIVLETSRATYALDDRGQVIGRSNALKGLGYSGRCWTIEGFQKRHHSRGMVTLAEALEGADISHGIVRDIDGRTARMWGQERAKRVYRASEDHAAQLVRAFGIPND